MNLAIISSNEIYQKTLLWALSCLNMDVCTYSNISEVVSIETIDIALCCISDDNSDEMIEFSKSVKCFGIVEKNIDIKDGWHLHFLSLFDAPVRLGNIIKSIQLYLKQREQRNSLTPIKMGSFILDPRRNNLNRDDVSIRLTEKEQDILLYLYSCKGTPVGRQSLLDHVWGYAHDVETHTLETHIYRLRQKIEIDPANPRFLVTDDEGYYLNF